MHAIPVAFQDAAGNYGRTTDLSKIPPSCNTHMGVCLCVICAHDWCAFLCNYKAHMQSNWEIFCGRRRPEQLARRNCALCSVADPSLLYFVATQRKMMRCSRSECSCELGFVVVLVIVGSANENTPPPLVKLESLVDVGGRGFNVPTTAGGGFYTSRRRYPLIFFVSHLLWH